MALGVEAVEACRSVYVATLADIVGALAKAECERRLRERIRWFCRAALLIADEIGYLPVVHGGGNLLFQLVNARYEKSTMILTSRTTCCGSTSCIAAKRLTSLRSLLICSTASGTSTSQSWASFLCPFHRFSRIGPIYNRPQNFWQNF